MDSDSETEHVVVSAVTEPAPIPEKKDVVKGQGRTDLWSQEETERLTNFVQAYGQKWTKICKEMPGRTPEQLSAKWYRSHEAKMDSKTWTDEETKILIEGFHELGGKWVQIARLLPGRTDKAVRNRFMRQMKKEERAAAADPNSNIQRDHLIVMPNDSSANFAALNVDGNGAPFSAMNATTAGGDKITRNKRPKKDSSRVEASSSSSSASVEHHPTLTESLMTSAGNAGAAISHTISNFADTVYHLADSDSSDDDDEEEEHIKNSVSTGINGKTVVVSTSPTGAAGMSTVDVVGGANHVIIPSSSHFDAPSVPTASLPTPTVTATGAKKTPVPRKVKEAPVAPETAAPLIASIQSAVSTVVTHATQLLPGATPVNESSDAVSQPIAPAAATATTSATAVGAALPKKRGRPAGATKTASISATAAGGVDASRPAVDAVDSASTGPVGVTVSESAESVPVAKKARGKAKSADI